MSEIWLILVGGLVGAIIGEIVRDARTWLTPRTRLAWAKLSQPKSQRILRLYRLELQELRERHANPQHVAIKGAFRTAIYLIVAILLITFCIIGALIIDITGELTSTDNIILTFSSYAAVALVSLALLKCIETYSTYKRATDNFQKIEDKLQRAIVDIEKSLSP